MALFTNTKCDVTTSTVLEKFAEFEDKHEGDSEPFAYVRYYVAQEMHISVLGDVALVECCIIKRYWYNLFSSH